ncbi:hypothetical protein SSS_08214 [Sarcoptes scabiei]|nr:hypothetical protein SSS_08214 [Sarcoptes scabiei]
MTDRMGLLECENKLLRIQQQNYSDLCKILTQRHLEIMKYLNHLKSIVEKIISSTSLSSTSKEPILIDTYFTEKTTYESQIAKYDQRIKSLAESIQSSQAKISDTEGNLLKEHLKLLTYSLVESEENHDSNKSISSKSIDDHCLVSLETGDDYFKKEPTNNDAVLYMPQMELEILDYNNSGSFTLPKNSIIIQANNNDSSNPNNTANSNEIQNDSNDPSEMNVSNQSGGMLRSSLPANSSFKKMSLCEYCGKYFNSHYLESHKRCHTGARPFKCSIEGCNRTFTQTSSRNVHEKRVHNFGKLECKCNYVDCNEVFTSITDLRKHIQQHQSSLDTVLVTQPQQSQNYERVQLVKIADMPQNFTKRVRRNEDSQTNGNVVYKSICQHCGKVSPTTSP